LNAAAPRAVFYGRQLKDSASRADFAAGEGRAGARIRLKSTSRSRAAGIIENAGMLLAIARRRVYTCR